MAGLETAAQVRGSLTIALTIFGVVLSTMHQSTLGTLYLITPTKLHPLWYSPHLPVHFFVSSIIAGISMVTVESMLSHRAFGSKVEIGHEQFDRLTLGLAKAGALVMAVYFALKVASVAHGNHWNLLLTPMGGWFLVEVLGFVALPGFLFAIAYRDRKPWLARAAAILGVLGVVLNRLNVSLIAFNWDLPSGQRYVPSWMEIWVSVTLVTIGVVVFRWIANRMPILHEHPDYKGTH